MTAPLDTRAASVGAVAADALPARSPAAVRVADLVELSKPRITTMVMVMAAAGAFLAAQGVPPLALLLPALAGTGLLAAGAGALNHHLEREADSRMRRTASRPLPAGRMDPEVALAFGVALVVAGLALLTLAVNRQTALLGAATVVGYLFVYTPLKRVTSLATVVGAVPGAIPPMIGWAAVRGELGAGAWALFGLLFCWQLPHFLSIAWIYREDYARGGFPMLTVGDPGGRRTARQVVLWGAALVPVSLAPVGLGLAGGAFFGLALALGLGYAAAGWSFAAARSAPAARRLLMASVLYLPAILAALVVDRLVG